MNWGEPWWLWELAGIGALALLLLLPAWRRRSAARWPRIARVVASPAGVQPVRAGRTVRRPWLLLLALAGVVASLARPQWGRIEEPVFQQAREVMLALDLSRSMGVPDVPPSRLLRARLLVQSLLGSLRGERVGLIVFAGTAFVQVPLSADYQILEDFLPELKTDYMPQGGTDYAGMLRAALGGFTSDAETDRYLIVLSDGESQTADWRALVPDVRERGVRVIALGVGTTAGGFIPDGENGYVKDERGAVVLSKLEPATLQELAAETRGVFRDASEWLDLPALLAATVERGRQGRFTEQRSVRHIERFQWLLAPAVLVALLGLWREITVRPRQTEIRRVPAPSPRPTSSGLATSMLAFALAALCLFGSPGARAADAPPPVEDPAARVRDSVARLATLPAPTARDWRELAERTLVYGTGARMRQETIVPGAIEDALAAVDRGEALDARLTDWPKLREDLGKLLESPPEQPQPEQQQPEQPPPPEQEQEKEKPNDQQQEQNQDQNQPQSGGDQKQTEPQPNESQSGQSQPQPSSQDPSQPAQQGEALGELAPQSSGEPPASPSPSDAPPPRTQKFGGRPAGTTPPPDSDPQLAAALQRLRQAAEADSPARLFELLQADEREAAPRGRDW